MSREFVGLDRRSFIRLGGLFGLTIGLVSYGGYWLGKSRAFDTDKRPYIFEPSYDILEKEAILQDGIVQVAQLVVNQVGIKAAYPELSKLAPFSLAVFYRDKAQRNNMLTNPNFFANWMNGETSSFNEPETGTSFSGPDYWKRLAQATTTDLVANDQFRINQVTAGFKNQTAWTTVEWQTGLYGTERLDPQNRYILAKILVHELTHAATPEGAMVYRPNGKNTLLNYGYPQTLNYYLGWVDAIINEYEYYNERFFGAEGDALVGFILEGKVIRAINEIAAMLVADYVLPEKDQLLSTRAGDEPLADFPITHAMVVEALSYVHYGAGKAGPKQLIGERTGLSQQTQVGRLHAKLLENIEAG